MGSRVLSDKEIKKYLGNKIFIWPFSTKKLKSSTYNLTASPVAFVEQKDDQGRSVYKYIVTEEGKIKIPPHSTALIQTEESVYVTGDICGTYHSRVGLVRKGLGHIGTTLDPHYFGTSLIALQNISDKDEYIAVGEEFVSLMLYKLSRKSEQLHDNLPGRADLYALDAITSFMYIADENAAKTKMEQIKNWRRQPWRNNLNDLEYEVKASLSNSRKNKILKTVSLICTAIQVLLVIGLVAFGLNFDFTGKEQASKIYIVLLGLLPQAVGWIREAISNHVIKGKFQNSEVKNESNI